MTHGKIVRSNPFQQTPIADAATATQDVASRPHSHGHFNGAMFQQCALSVLMRRGPIPRMPLRNAGSGKRGVGPRRPRGGESLSEVELERDDDFLAEDPNTNNFTVHFHSFQGSGDQESNSGRDQERRFAGLFQMPSRQLNDVVPKKESFTTPGSRPVARATAQLPPMQSLDDVAKFVKGAIDQDPSGRSVPHILRTINAAMLRQEINLPAITKVADAREVLVDIFGSGHADRKDLSQSMRNLYLMLPLWLVNLGRQRTNDQRIQAAARVSSQTAAFDIK